MKDTVKISRETYDKLTKLYEDKQSYERDQYKEFKTKYFEAISECTKLQRENGYLRALFDKETDTDVIKYNGRLYRIISTTNSRDVDGSDFLDISAELVRGDSK